MMIYIYFESKELAKAIDLCFANARNNADFSASQRQQFLFRGKILRGEFVNLVSAAWKEEYEERVSSALTELGRINRVLASTTETLNRYAATIERLANIAKELEELLKLASKFI